MSISSSKTFMHLSLVKPRGWSHKSGQYAFINIPSIRTFEWHAFSIASSPNSEYLQFMIKKAGDWSDKLIDTFYDIKEQSYKQSVGDIVDSQYEDEFRKYLMQMNDDITEEIVKRNMAIFPKVFVSESVSAPAEMAARRRRLILVGAGSGIAPFLAFLDDQKVRAQGGRMRDGEIAASYREEFASTEKAHLIFASRDASQFSWLSPYINKIMSNDQLFDKVVLHMHLTGTKCNTLPSFLFWRAFLLLENMKRQQNRQTMNMIVGSSIQLKVGRPNFDNIIQTIHKNEPGDYFVYVCGADQIVKQTMAACNKVSKDSQDKFILKYEVF